MSYTAESFLNKIHDDVIADMKETKILASLTAAQALIESNKGNSGLTRECNNLFGIKGSYQGQYGEFWTTEYVNGVAVRVKAKFRKYPDWISSIHDHSALFTNSKRYKNLVGCTDYVKACTNVKNDGYATSPSYTQTLIKTINTYKLYLWDQEVSGKTNTVIKPAPSLPLLKKGSRGQQVKAWQYYLFIHGYNPGMVDGIFGQLTEDAVKAYQSDHNLVADGIIGPKTWASTGIDYSNMTE